ncbi:MAG: Ni/Fe-hydrogenase cytochrome b subunit [Ignavibacteria bacterium]|nr:Ni/Fe-hydrogenase cytochrome b subunit [Ignavibacteria bacterium]MBT8381710.1 Ni/Fe-hydrogenase cytochrome b subunit [Ignavibacteria bacterium]MBT8392836.1 Ni/Fe-hydrogenase cytochrome b subunit [Ignavibacteria bacterium]NNJ52135.1 Ni/Fe-hydrogenase cytochrome b subunit [Ignavibacteriaceae bacterium]NNL20221.1 Ni/Fe-hydrogenase cytochrome b subunit [Ignavibacteriaceae bacterium]
MIEYGFQPKPIKRKFFTPWVIVISIIAFTGLIFLASRFIFGLGSVTNLNQFFPWGIWIGLDVAAGVALAAGGFTAAALGHIWHRDKYEIFIRPALLTALLGYTFVALSVVTDIGRWNYVWHPLVMWNGNSALFEVGICVMVYLSVLYIEFLPIVTERFIGKVNLPGFLSVLNKAIDSLLRILDRTLNKFMFVFIIAGVVLSCLHQSSLGTLMIIAGQKMHPLWQTPVLPLLFLLSAFSVGFPMVIMESLSASKSFGMKPEKDILSSLAKFVGPLLSFYLAFKIGDMVIRESFVYLTEFNAASIMFTIEVVIGVALPLRLFLSPSVRESSTGLFIASMLVIFGVLINRFNNFVIAYDPPYTETSYFPSVGEIAVTLGFVALEILLYRAFVMIFPIISQPIKGAILKTKYAIKGAR